MDSDRRTAIIVGVLFIIATAASLVASALKTPVFDAGDYLATTAADAVPVKASVLFELAAAASIVLIPAFLFPILRRYDERIAIGYLAIRIMEAMTLVAGVMISLLLITLSQAYVDAGAPVASHFEVDGALLQGANDWVFPLNPIVFGPGALLLYSALYRWRLVPRWLSGGGVIGAVMVVAGGLTGLFGEFVIWLALPIAAQEMVMALWFIFVGFRFPEGRLSPALRQGVAHSGA